VTSAFCAPETFQIFAAPRSTTVASSRFAGKDLAPQAEVPGHSFRQTTRCSKVAEAPISKGFATLAGCRGRPLWAVVVAPDSTIPTFIGRTTFLLATPFLLAVFIQLIQSPADMIVFDALNFPRTP